ncbi:trypsin-like peptidase domain-containing protein [Streptomyces sp. TRM 70361]|uniref:S1C family serine protease n=1 Tax=Streptomyces sp. TRM 70361 TaxID=3116553 RepID=UPI002E7BDB46|nr:trypsin-like peptidase domain-containing protein [Streptomyces sp. TRM 70361]MEE1942503.1 trypsin-like peptidase domain-containing protein [Streptomyces sp. TRM 70361]
MSSSRGRGGLRAGAAALCAAAVLFTGCTGGGSDEDSGSSPSPSASVPVPGEADALQDAFQDVVDQVLPSVVQVTTGQGLGSGVVYDEEGHIVTNAHVVGDAERFRVTLATGRDDLAAELVASYPDEDLAVVKLTDPPGNLRPATFGKSSEVDVGQIVLAMGNPLGLSSSVTEGIVSATGRSLSEGSAEATLGNLIQTSAPINPGNSGGALVDLSGRVIGVPTLAAGEQGGGTAPGLGFAIPSDTVRHLADQMIEHGEVRDSDEAALEATVRTVLGDDYRPAGVAVVEVEDGGAADEAGLREGDVITAVGGTDTPQVTALAQALASREPGDEVEVTYRRGGDERTVTVTLGER